VILDGRVTVRHDASLEARLPRRADAVCEQAFSCALPRRQQREQR
jgi:hypothetical protein